MKHIVLYASALLCVAPALHAQYKQTVQDNLEMVVAKANMIKVNAQSLLDLNEKALVCGKGKNPKEKLDKAYVTILEDCVGNAESAIGMVSTLLSGLQSTNFCVTSTSMVSTIESLWNSVKTTLASLKKVTESLYTKTINGKKMDRCLKGEVQASEKKMMEEMFRLAEQAEPLFYKTMIMLRDGEGKAWCVK